MPLQDRGIRQDLSNWRNFKENVFLFCESSISTFFKCKTEFYLYNSSVQCTCNWILIKSWRESIGMIPITQYRSSTICLAKNLNLKKTDRSGSAWLLVTNLSSSTNLAARSRSSLNSQRKLTCSKVGKQHRRKAQAVRPPAHGPKRGGTERISLWRENTSLQLCAYSAHYCSLLRRAGRLGKNFRCASHSMRGWKPPRVMEVCLSWHHTLCSSASTIVMFVPIDSKLIFCTAWAGHFSDSVLRCNLFVSNHWMCLMPRAEHMPAYCSSVQTGFATGLSITKLWSAALSASMLIPYRCGMFLHA